MLTAAYSSTAPNICHSRFLGTRDPTRGPLWEPMTILRISGNASSGRRVPCIQPVTALLAGVYIIDAVWRPASDNVTFRLYAGGKACLLEPDGKSIADTDLGFLSSAYRSASAHSQERLIEYQVGDRIGWHTSEIANVMALLE